MPTINYYYGLKRWSEESVTPLASFLSHSVIPAPPNLFIYFFFLNQLLIFVIL